MSEVQYELTQSGAPDGCFSFGDLTPGVRFALSNDTVWAKSTDGTAQFVGYYGEKFTPSAGQYGRFNPEIDVMKPSPRLRCIVLKLKK